MSLISCSECGKEISDKAEACPHCGAPIAGTLYRPKKSDPNACAKCGTHYITEQKNATFSPVSILTIPMFLGGVAMLLFNWLAALLVIGLAFMIDHFGRSKKTVLVCPKCRHQPY